MVPSPLLLHVADHRCHLWYPPCSSLLPPYPSITVFWFYIPHSFQICTLSLNRHCYAPLLSGQLTEIVSRLVSTHLVPHSAILHVVLRMDFSKHNSESWHRLLKILQHLPLLWEWRQNSWADLWDSLGSGVFSFLPLQPHPGFYVPHSAPFRLLSSLSFLAGAFSFSCHRVFT